MSCEHCKKDEVLHLADDVVDGVATKALCLVDPDGKLSTGRIMTCLHNGNGRIAYDRLLMLVGGYNQSIGVRSRPSADPESNPTVVGDVQMLSTVTQLNEQLTAARLQITELTTRATALQVEQKGLGTRVVREHDRAESLMALLLEARLRYEAAESHRIDLERQNAVLQNQLDNHTRSQGGT